jgi:DNA-binding CsgD family transcriptional regulator
MGMHMVNNELSTNTIRNKNFFVLDKPIKAFYKLADKKENITIGCKNLDLRYYHCNEQMKQLHGWHANESYGLTICDIVSESSASVADQIQDIDKEMLVTGKTKFFVRELNIKNQSTISEVGFRALIKDSSNNIAGLFGMGMAQTLNAGERFKSYLSSEELNPFMSFPKIYFLFNCCPAFYTLLKAKLTQRETETLYFFIRYRSIKMIARMLGNISPRTVEDHLYNCKKKLRVRTTIELSELLWGTNFVHISLEQIRGLIVTANYYWK